MRIFSRKHEPRRAARSAALIAAAAVVLALVGCGDHNLVLNTNVLSYLDASATDFTFGPVPALPGGLTTGEQNVVNDANVNLVGNFSDVASVKEVSMRIEVASQSYSGDGSDTLRLYLSDPDTSPRSTPPVFEQPIVLTSGVSDTTLGTFSGDQRVLDLFAGKQMRLALTTALRGPSAGADLSGRVHVTRLDATVVAGRKGAHSGP